MSKEELVSLIIITNIYLIIHDYRTENFYMQIREEVLKKLLSILNCGLVS